MHLFKLAPLLLCLFAYAAPKAKPHPSAKRKVAGEAPVLVASTLFGDKSSLFTITSKSGKNLIVFQTSYGENLTHDLKPADLTFLLSEFDKLPSPAKVPDSCYRAQANVQRTDSQGKTTSKGSCFGMNSISEPRYVRFFNLLALAVR